MIFGECCDCQCHEEGRHIKHIMACCQTCSFCNKRIVFTMYETHRAKCEDLHNPLVNGVRFNEILKAIMLLQEAGIDTSSTSMHLTELLNKAQKKD
jgi:hypothetical protein